MNGEIQQISNIVIGARKALYDNSDIEFDPGEYVLSIKFLFAPKFKFCKPIEADSVCDWFRLCKERFLEDIKFLVSTDTSHKHLLGFSNTSRSVIACFWKKGRVSYFLPTWVFDRDNNGWKVVYCEQLAKKHQNKKPLFSNQTEAFKSILLDIGKFAADIGFPGFSDIFHVAYEALCDCAHMEDDNISAPLPHDFKGIYYAVDKADVFGAMGSWTDSPPFYAHQKGLEREYNELSDRLLTQLRLNLMYVVNECWKKD